MTLVLLHGPYLGSLAGRRPQGARRVPSRLRLSPPAWLCDLPASLEPTLGVNYNYVLGPVGP